MTEKLKALLEYQAADMEVEKIEREVLRSDERRKANQYKQKFQNATEDKKKITLSLSHMKDELQKLAGQYDDVIKTMLAQRDKLQQEITQLEQIDEIEGTIAKLLQIAGKLESELRRIADGSAQLDTKLTELEETAESARNEFNRCKGAYETMLEKIKPQLEEAKQKRTAKETKVDEKLLTKYTNLKKNNVSPVAKLDGRNCSGCHMELPSAIIARVTAEEGIVECENCGRIIYTE